jgi:hypothetical protein
VVAGKLVNMHDAIPLTSWIIDLESALKDTREEIGIGREPEEGPMGWSFKCGPLLILPIIGGEELWVPSFISSFV